MTANHWCHGMPPQPAHAVPVSVETSDGLRLCPRCFRRWQAEDRGRRPAR